MRWMLWSSTALACLAVPGAAVSAQAPAMDMKAGLWECKTTLAQHSPQPGLDGSAIAHEQRARDDAALKASVPTGTKTAHVCLTPERIASAEFVTPPSMTCQTSGAKVLSR